MVGLEHLFLDTHGPPSRGTRVARGLITLAAWGLVAAIVGAETFQAIEHSKWTPTPCQILASDVERPAGCDLRAGESSRGYPYKLHVRYRYQIGGARIAADRIQAHEPTDNDAATIYGYARQYPVPTYVVEFLLGRYCASIKEEEIAEGLEIVQKQLKGRTVRTGEEELFKARAREDGAVKLIDIVRARLDSKNDCYVAEVPSLTLRDVQVADSLVKENERMLTDGFYAEITLEYDPMVAQEKTG